MPFKHPALLCAALAATAACASFRPRDISPSVRPLYTSEGGSCTAWAVGPRKWITAAHCTEHGAMRLDGAPAALLAVDTGIDLALVGGPSAHPLRLATAHPQLGDPLHVFGYGMGKGVLMLLPGVYLHGNSEFFGEGEALLVGIANGMPGMSGGPILAGQRVVSVLTGGGTATSPAHLIGTGVPLTALRRFVIRTKADAY